ncbi:MAG: hypothetical protein QXT64_06480 [Desulfurococcaceae archaeon]
MKEGVAALLIGMTALLIASLLCYVFIFEALRESTLYGVIFGAFWVLFTAAFFALARWAFDRCRC